jgi:hypothetical protein
MKMFSLKAIFIIGHLIFSASASPPPPTQAYPNKIVLAEPNKYILYWNFTDSDILFEVHTQTNGWLGFGLSPNGNMINSDIIITWIDSNGHVNFTDRNIKSKNEPPRIDKVQNWFLLSAMIKDGYVISKFTRKIKLCDATGEDLNIEPGTPYLIYAWGEKFTNNDISYHEISNRGSKTVPLIARSNSKSAIDTKEIEMVDFRVNVS